MTNDTMPEKIYVGTYRDGAHLQVNEWFDSWQYEGLVEYTRTDIHDAVVKQRDELLEVLNELTYYNQYNKRRQTAYTVNTPLSPKQEQAIANVTKEMK